MTGPERVLAMAASVLSLMVVVFVIVAVAVAQLLLRIGRRRDD